MSVIERAAAALIDPWAKRLPHSFCISNYQQIGPVEGQHYPGGIPHFRARCNNCGKERILYGLPSELFYVKGSPKTNKGEVRE